MGALITQACRENQRNAAEWYASARKWQENANLPGGAAYASDCLHWARVDQINAARLSRADRLLRGLEA